MNTDTLESSLLTIERQYIPPVVAPTQICCIVLDDRDAVRRMKVLVQQNQCAKVKQQREFNWGAKWPLSSLKLGALIFLNEVGNTYLPFSQFKIKASNKIIAAML